MSLADLIATRSPVLLDGGMGTQLVVAGLEMGGHNCVSHPDRVLVVHKQYTQAGCDLLVTNTFTMNRLYLETHGMDVDVKDVNLAGARLARTADGPSRSRSYGELAITTCP